MTDYNAELGHVQLEVADLERSTAFYTRFLGLRVTERMESRKGHVVLLSGGDRHREVALRAAPEPGDGGDEDPDGGPRPGTAMAAPFQVAFEVPDRRAFADLVFELRKEGIPTTAVDHGVSWAVYFRDPDGNAVEAYWDTREEDGGRDRWDGRSRLLALDHVLAEERMRELAQLREQAEAEAAAEASADEEDDPEEDGAPAETGPSGDRSASSD